MASPANNPTTRRERQRLEIRDRLLEAVLRLNSSGNDFASLSVERLAQEASTSRSTFYVYFEDKADLLRSLTVEIGEELERMAVPWLEIRARHTRQQLGEMLERFATAYLPHADILAVVFATATYDAEVRQTAQNLFRSQVDALQRHIIEGSAAGFVDPTLEARPTAFWLISMIERGFNDMLRVREDSERKLLLDSLADLVWQALYALAD